MALQPFPICTPAKVRGSYLAAAVYVDESDEYIVDDASELDDSEVENEELC